MKNNDAQLIQRVLEGDDTAFSVLVRKYQKSVHALAWRKIGDFHIAEDITQDTFLQAYQKLSTLRKPQRFAGWLYVIAANYCKMWLRQKRLSTQSLENTSSAQLEKATYSGYVIEENERTTAEAQREIVKKLLAKLQESERTVITLYYLGGMNYEQISEFLGMSVSAIKSRLHRARQRLKKEEPMIREALGNFQITPNLSENIMREISRMNPIAPSSSKPLVPWAIGVSTLVVVFLMVGVGSQYLSRFQKPYSFDATSEMTVELIEAPIVLSLESKPDVRTQLGNVNTPSKNNASHRQPNKEKSVVHETLKDFQHSDDLVEDIMKWTRVREPGILGEVGTLSGTSENTLYTVIGDRSIYKLPSGEEAWQLVDDTFLYQNTGGNIPIAERDGTLYIILSNELYASTDDGETWHFVGTCPQGYVRELRVTEDALYLCLSDGIFRSDDAGNSWKDISNGLDDRLSEHSGIHSLQMSQGTLFVKTDLGLYRLEADTWQHLRLPVDEAVHVGSLAIYEDEIYVIASVNILDFYGAPKDIWERLWKGEMRSWWIFRSTDGGDAWKDITPMNAWNLTGFRPDITLITTRNTLLAIGNDDGMVARSVDSGDTWTSIASSGISPIQFSVRCAVALDGNTFYTGGSSGIHRSTDGGKTWHRFHTGLESRVDNLVSFVADQAPDRSAALYASVGKHFVKSNDGGTSWEAVSLAVNPSARLSQKQQPEIVQVAKTNGVLYAKGIQEIYETAIFQLSSDGNTLIPVTGTPPSLSSSGLVQKVLAGKRFTFRDERRSVPELRVGFSGVADALLDDLSKTPDFGADSFFERLVERQIDPRVVYELIREGLWGNFAVSDETFYMEYNYKLFRWKPGDPEWHDTGLEETGELRRETLWRGFKIAASDGTVYVGKRDGHLLQSLDGGDTWNDVTPNLPFSIEHFKEIVFADSTVCVATDKGVFYSKDGVVWNVLVDETGKPVIIKSLSTIGDSVYGANDEGIYYLQGETDTWEQIAPEVSGVVTSLVVDENMFYVGTERRGVLRFERTSR
ncbi:MAG: sigma-70 family RNA polymerase sigma factor [Candidatus Poribacteria bacterium]|nr:sigma-70 family RNA polymerase sigma factor [Candidatus Poribacteria bacterium]